MANKKIPTIVGTVVIIIIAITTGVFVWQDEKNQPDIAYSTNKIYQKKQQVIDMDQQSKDALIQKAADELNNVKFEAGTENLKEGEEFDSGFDIKVKNECATGLTPVVAAQEFNGECAYPMCSCYVCTRCGDGICGKGENVCNCSNDCKKGEGKQVIREDLFDPQFYSNSE